jgi:hypothetical protein
MDAAVPPRPPGVTTSLKVAKRAAFDCALPRVPDSGVFDTKTLGPPFRERSGISLLQLRPRLRQPFLPKDADSYASLHTGSVFLRRWPNHIALLIVRPVKTAKQVRQLKLCATVPTGRIAIFLDRSTINSSRMPNEPLPPRTKGRRCGRAYILL